jgi:hypothetical protein
MSISIINHFCHYISRLIFHYKGLKTSICLLSVPIIQPLQTRKIGDGSCFLKLFWIGVKSKEQHGFLKGFCKKQSLE